MANAYICAYFCGGVYSKGMGKLIPDGEKICLLRRYLLVLY